MNIIDIIQKESNCIYRKKSSIHGGEYSGACPWCSGEDRFSIHPSKNHYVCRRCQRAGDAINFIMEYLSKDYKQACEYLDIIPQFKFSSLDTAKDDSISWQPRKITFPDKRWQKKAEQFLFEKFKYLMGPNGKNKREYLSNRGINDKTIKIARIGYNDRSVVFEDKSWGIDQKEYDRSNKPNIWIPEGIIIPQFWNGELIRLRIRQTNPLSLTRFIVVKGSSTGFFDYEAHLNSPSTIIKRNNKPWIIVESDIDGWLLYQEIGDSCSILSIGNSSSRPDIATHEILKNNSGLVCLDNDKAGHKESEWWEKQYPNASIHYSAKGKDPGEDFQAGIDISEWIKEGLSKIDLSHLDTEKVPQDFKQKTIKKYKEKLKSNTKVKLKQKKIIQTKNENINECVHGRSCVHLSQKNTICLVGKRNPFFDMECPKLKWKAVKTGQITEIILLPGYE